MAKIKLALRKFNPNDVGEQPIYVRISHRGTEAYINTNIYVHPDKWDSKVGKVIEHPRRKKYNDALELKLYWYKDKFMELADKVPVRSLTALEIKARIENNGLPQDFTEKFTDYMDRRDTPRTRELYRITLMRIQGYKEVATFDEITLPWVRGFESYLKRLGNSTNTIAIHMRNLRAVVNEAIDDEMTTVYAFRKFKIKKQKTAKRALSVERLRALIMCDCEPRLKVHRDMFCLMFMLIGINLVDLSKLKFVEDGRINYVRTKTHRPYSIKVEPEALDIIGRYRGVKHLIDIFDRYAEYRDYTGHINDALSKLCDGRVTTYWARHSWATIAASLDIPKDTIAAALGHGGDSVTDVYIDFDMKKVDEANRRVLDYVLYGR